jgi:hypothetical protein
VLLVGVTTIEEAVETLALQERVVTALVVNVTLVPWQTGLELAPMVTSQSFVIITKPFPETSGLVTKPD